MNRLILFMIFICILSTSNNGQIRKNSWKVFTVPLEVVTKQEIASLPKGWNVNPIKYENRISGITIFDGPPEDNASLVYDNEANKKQEIVFTWNFTDNENNGIWIVCRYDGTSIQIKKQLPVGIKKLRIIYDNTIKVSGEPVIKKIEYK